MKYKRVNPLVGQKLMFEYGMGNSSQSILGTYLGEPNNSSHPYDSSDFLRCLGLVIAFDIDINVMKDSSDTWNQILEQWDELVTLGLDGDRKGINNILDEITRQ